jgi:hypothetical protein
MTTDTCGAETTGDQPCQNPAGENGRCWIPTHNPDSDEENPQGRPTKFTDERARDAIHAADELGKSKRGCARDAGVSKDTIDEWLEQNPTFEGPDGDEYHFFDAFERARGSGETYYIREGRDPDGDVDPSFARFMLASSYGYKKTEKREHTGDGGGPVEITFTEQVVETDWEDDE